MISGSRLIAFLDILGFKEILKKKEIDLVYADFEKLVDEASHAKRHWTQDYSTEENFAYFQFMSDSLILVSNDLTHSFSVQQFICGIANLMSRALTAGFLFRGSIGESQVATNAQKGIFLATNFPSIYEFESAQDWMGCAVLDKNAEAIIMNAIYGHQDFNKIENDLCGPIHHVDGFIKNSINKKAICINYLFEHFFAHGTTFVDQISVEKKRETTRKYVKNILRKGVKLWEFDSGRYVIVQKFLQTWNLIELNDEFNPIYTAMTRETYAKLINFVHDNEPRIVSFCRIKN